MEHRHRKRGPHYFVTVRHASWQDNWVEKHQNQKSGISRYNIVARLSTGHKLPCTAVSFRFKESGNTVDYTQPS